MEEKKQAGQKPGATGRKAAATGQRPAVTGRKAGTTEPGRRRRRNARRKEKENKSKVIPVLLIVAVLVFLFSGCQLAMSLYPYLAGGKEYDEVKELAIESDDVGDGFKVDFAFLARENPDVVAWIRFEEPAIINYPVVQSKDNNEYLTKTFFANDNKLGAIFMDMRNTSFNDRNVFIYGHNLKIGGEMFSQLTEYADEEFCKKYPYFYIYTPDGKTRTYKVFSASVVKAEAENYTPSYLTEKDFTDYLKVCKRSSNYDVDVELDAQSKIVSLSTCTNVRDDERFLVQGVLVDED